MSDTVIIGILSLAGTMLGTFGGILTSSKLTNYRIEQLENKVGEHNNFAQRMPVVEEQIKEIWHRLAALEEK
jgi:hypothetical protein